MIAQSDINSWLLALNNHLKDLLVNDLGQYDLIVNNAVRGTIPSIKIEPRITENNTQFRLRDKSGIECIVHRELGFKHQYMSGGSKLSLDFKIELVQYKREVSLNNAVLKIVLDDYFEIYKDPIITPSVESPTGIILERAIIEVNVTQRIQLN